MNVPVLFPSLSLMCFVLRQTQRDNESPHPWDLAGPERVVGGVDKDPSPNATGSYPQVGMLCKILREALMSLCVTL